MSENMRNKPSGDQSNSRNNESGDRKRYDGFEGMNYEQVRQPYNPQDTRRNNEETDGPGGGKRREEL